MKVCSECKFWNTEGVKPRTGYMRTCARYPPNSEGRHAMSRASDWCGEWQAIPTARKSEEK